ncbi:c heme lyase [Seminavis robusta]|uniref:Holocytochrome c-type synthase n=1 Tax=Seminavis robusta TaxID=568900 RepID=A0A9N8DBI2_9STRA|nr:c heme lyase [Seminavis robusta]|eukprot:Sro20_g013990.1 c heme lyase (339) ;mRNA; f:50817-51833
MVASNSNSEGGGSGGCPVAKDSTTTVNDNTASSSWSAWLGFGNNSKTTVPSIASSNKDEPSSSTTIDVGNGCPVQHSDKTPSSLEEAAGYSQRPHPDQQGVELSTRRVVSSIPRGSSTTEEKGPHHQPKTDQQPPNWVYPSEQQFFHALRRKGWDHVQASSVPTVLEIHNSINERTWKQVLEWEQDMDLPVPTTTSNGPAKFVETNLKLVRFLGRPSDLSPQAFLWTKIMQWNEPPFDRHDWYVQKQPSRQNNNVESEVVSYPIQRYVIDYYMVPPPHPDLPPKPYVDVRPALDSPRAVSLRARRFLQDELPALWTAYVDYKAQQPRYYDGHGPYTKK